MIKTVFSVYSKSNETCKEYCLKVICSNVICLRQNNFQLLIYQLYDNKTHFITH